MDTIKETISEPYKVELYQTIKEIDNILSQDATIDIIFYLSNEPMRYKDLKKQHPHKLENEDYGITVDRPDYWFLACLCWIARNNKIQQNLWEEVRMNFGEKYNGDIRNIKTESDSENIGYPKNFVPYNWLPKLSKYLYKEGINFKTYIKNIENKTGIEIQPSL